MPRFAAMTALGLALCAGPAFAQTNAIPSASEEVMVRVEVSHIGEALAGELGVATDTLPRSVEVTIEVASVVCDIPVEQLEHVRAVEQHVECKASTVSPELVEATEKEIAQQ